MANYAITRRLMAIALAILVGTVMIHTVKAAPAAATITPPADAGECAAKATKAEADTCCATAPRGWRAQCSKAVRRIFRYETRAARPGFTPKGAEKCLAAGGERAAVSCCYALPSGRAACLEDVLVDVQAGKIPAADADEFPPSERERALEELASRARAIAALSARFAAIADLKSVTARVTALEALQANLPTDLIGRAEIQKMIDASEAKMMAELKAVVEDLSAWKVQVEELVAVEAERNDEQDARLDQLGADLHLLGGVIGSTESIRAIGTALLVIRTGAGADVEIGGYGGTSIGSDPTLAWGVESSVLWYLDEDQKYYAVGPGFRWDNVDGTSTAGSKEYEVTGGVKFRMLFGHFVAGAYVGPAYREGTDGGHFDFIGGLFLGASLFP